MSAIKWIAALTIYTVVAATAGWIGAIWANIRLDRIEKRLAKPTHVSPEQEQP